jgi:hypothetical protein
VERGNKTGDEAEQGGDPEREGQGCSIDGNRSRAG